MKTGVPTYKVLALTAAADGLELCDEVHMEKAIRWTEWQICVRRVFQPSEALSFDSGEMTEEFLLQNGIEP
jgi:hypothetical protein